ncbi:MAG: Cys-tRNA(Pro) deacylase [Desertimonas sp.]
MTPAVVALQAAGVSFSIHEYHHRDGVRDYGMEAATELGLDPDEVFKTLLVTGERAGVSETAVAIVPVSARLSLKAVGAVLGLKRVEMCDPDVAQRLTGYVLGGISPFGQRKRLRTVIDETSELHDRVYVSGGRRGLDVGLAPVDLVVVLDAVVGDITA